MGIEAYLEVEKDDDLQELEELSPEAYKGLTQELAINKAEQAIIEEVVGVDGDDDENDEEELRDEREMKTLFEQLYEVDPDTKEVFVKGSAYDLKKWDEDMVCFTFGDPERVIELEAAISPGERYLAKCFSKLTAKRDALSEVVRCHSNHLRAKTISKSFAKDFQGVMGYPIPNLHMESFTVMPSQTNYSLAMEEMSTQQMALTAGAGLAGIAIVYKLIQWFAKALNKNSLATNSISKNFQAYGERKEMLKNLPGDLKKLSANVDVSLKKYMQANDDNKTQDINGSIAKLKEKFNSNDAVGAYDEAALAILSNDLKGKLNPFMLGCLEGKISTNFWKNLSIVLTRAKEAQTTILSRLEDIDKQYALDKANDNNQKTSSYLGLNEAVRALNLTSLTQDTESGIVWSMAPKIEDTVEFASWFSTVSTTVFRPYQDDRKVAKLPWNFVSLATIDVKIFANLDSGHVEEMKKAAESLKKHAEDAAKKGREASKENKIEKGDRAKVLMDLSKEFQYVSSVLRFVIMIRNDLGKLSQQLAGASEKSIGFLKATGLALNKLAQIPGAMTDKFKEGLNGDV